MSLPADLTVDTARPGFSRSLSPNPASFGDVVTVTHLIDNTLNTSLAVNPTFSEIFPAGIPIASPSNASTTCAGGTVTAPPRGNIVSFSGGTVAAGTSCNVVVDIVGGLTGDTALVSGPLTSIFGFSSVSSGNSSATLTVTAHTLEEPTISKIFSGDPVGPGGTATLEFTIINTANVIEATSLAFTDALATGVVIAPSPGVENTCGGTVNTSDPSEIAFSGGTVAAGDTCEISVTLQGLGIGTFDNVTSTLTSSVADADPATDTLTINAVPLVLSMGFDPSSIEQFQTSTVTYSFRNTSTITATGITLTDVLPTCVTIASPEVKSKTCSGGMVSAPAGGTTIEYAGGELAPGLGCSISIVVISYAVGAYSNATESASSLLGTSTNASATLAVDEATTGTVTIEQDTDTDGDYAFTSAETLLNFTITTTGGTGSAGPVTLPVGSYTISQAPPEGVGNTSITCGDGNSTGDPLERTIKVEFAALEAVTCTITSISTRQKTVDTINRFLTRRADLILSSEPRPGRRFDRLDRGSGNASRFSWSPGDLKAFLPFTAEINRASNEYRFSTSLVQMREAGASLQLAHGAKPDAVYVDNYRFDAWFEAQYKEFDGSESEGEFAIAYIGVDYLLTPDILVGALLQIDHMDDSPVVNTSSVDGAGLMVGPYITARLAPNLVFDGRIAAGRSTNDVSPFNTYTDEFDTDRWLAMASLTGQFQSGLWTIRPTASLSYYNESQDSYIDSLGVFIPSQTVELGQFKLGPTFTGNFTTPGGMNYSPYFSLDAIYNLGDTSGVVITDPSTAEVDGWRARLQAGVDFTTRGGARISFGGSYDGIGQDDLDVWGVMLDVTIPLSKAWAR